MGAGRVDPQKGAPGSGREAALAFALLSRQLELHRKGPQGGDGPQVMPRPQIACGMLLCSWPAASVTALTLSHLGVNSRGNTPAAAYYSSEQDESHKLGFLGMLGAPRVRRLSNPPPPAEEQHPAIPTSGPSFPGHKRRRRRRQYCALEPSARGGVTGVSRRTTHRGYS